jgi:DNA polymerase III subunit tau, C-terminal domain
VRARPEPAERSAQASEPPKPRHQSAAQPTLAAKPDRTTPVTEVAPTTPPTPEPATTRPVPVMDESPAAADTTAGPAQVAADAPEGDLERLQRGWAEVVAVVSKSPPLKPLIESCRPIGIEGSLVTLGFPEEKDFLREAAERKRASIEAGISGFLGHDVGIRCVVSNLDLLPPLPRDTDAAHILAEAQRIFAEDMADVGEVS